MKSNEKAARPPNSDPKVAAYKSLLADNITYAVADASNDGILLIDSNHIVVFMNKALKLWLHWSDIQEDDIVGKLDRVAYKVIASVVVEPLLFESLCQSLEGNSNLINETIDIEFKNSIYKYINVYTAPIYHEKDGYLGRQWVFDDRTKDHLIDQVKTEFISIASHQLRTPITAIRGYLSMLRDGDAGSVTGDVKEFVDAAYEGSERLVELVEDLLNISRFDMGKTVPVKQEVQLEEVFDRILQIHEQNIKSKSIKINKNLSFKGAVFSLDEKLIGHAVGNVLDNAVKYTKENGDIFVDAEVVEHEGNRILKIAIKDSGVGIPKEQQSRIFEKFFRADNVRSDDFSGTGIGLYYVHKIVGSMNGKVWFESEEGQGTTFFIEIPE